MQRLTYPKERLVDKHGADVEVLVRQMADAGYEISDRDAALAWRDHSAKNGTVWLPAPSDEHARETVWVMLKMCARERAAAPRP